MYTYTACMEYNRPEFHKRLEFLLFYDHIVDDNCNKDYEFIYSIYPSFCIGQFMLKKLVMKNWYKYTNFNITVSTNRICFST